MKTWGYEMRCMRWDILLWKLDNVFNMEKLDEACNAYANFDTCIQECQWFLLLHNSWIWHFSEDDQRFVLEFANLKLQSATKHLFTVNQPTEGE